MLVQKWLRSHVCLYRCTHAVPVESQSQLQEQRNKQKLACKEETQQLRRLILALVIAFYIVCMTQLWPGMLCLLQCKIIVWGIPKSGHFHTANRSHLFRSVSHFDAHPIMSAVFTPAQMNCTKFVYANFKNASVKSFSSPMHTFYMLISSRSTGRVRQLHYHLY